MITIYHHSRCTVSREALTLLDQLCARENLLLEILDYHQLLLTAPILSDLQKKLGLPMREMIRYHDPKYIRLKLSKADDAGLFSGYCETSKTAATSNCDLPKSCHYRVSGRVNRTLVLPVAHAITSRWRVIL